MSYLVSNKEDKENLVSNKEDKNKEKEKKKEETVIGTVERFPLPARPAMNPSAMAAAVARHQVTKQIKSGVGRSKQINKGKMFFFGSNIFSYGSPFLCYAESCCVIHRQFGANIAKYLPLEVGKEI